MSEPDADEESDKLRYANAISELIQFVRLMAKRHRLKPLEVIGIYKLVEDILLSGGSNIEMALVLKDLKESGLLPKRAIQTDQKEVKNEGYI